MPGKPSSTSRTRSITQVVPPCFASGRHSSVGAIWKNMSVSFRPTGSMPSSSAPARAMMPRTSGTRARISAAMRMSVSAALSTLMVGCLRTVTTGVPSSMVGMKMEPICPKARKAATSPAMAVPPITSGFFSAHSRKGS